MTRPVTIRWAGGILVQGDPVPAPGPLSCVRVGGVTYCGQAVTTTPHPVSQELREGREPFPQGGGRPDLTRGEGDN